MRLNSRMRGLIHVDEAGLPRADAELPAECEEWLAAGWRTGPGGMLLLARAGAFLAPGREVPADEVGAREYEYNDFLVPHWDLARGVPSFAPRFADDSWTEDDPEVSYLGPDGRFPADVAGFLKGMAARGVTFAVRALARAREQQLDGAARLTAIVSIGTASDVLVHGTHLRFTTARGKPARWFDLAWFSDLERFRLSADAVLTLADVRQT